MRKILGHLVAPEQHLERFGGGFADFDDPKDRLKFNQSGMVERIFLVMKRMIRQATVHRYQFALHLADPRSQGVDEFAPKQRRGLNGRFASLPFVPPQFVRFHFLDKQVHPRFHLPQRLAFRPHLRNDSELVEIFAQGLPNPSFNPDAIGLCAVSRLRSRVRNRPMPIGIRSLRKTVESAAIGGAAGEPVIERQRLPVQGPSHACAEP